MRGLAILAALSAFIFATAGAALAASVDFTSNATLGTLFPSGWDSASTCDGDSNMCTVRYPAGNNRIDAGVIGYSSADQALARLDPSVAVGAVGPAAGATVSGYGDKALEFTSYRYNDGDTFAFEEIMFVKGCYVVQVGLDSPTHMDENGGRVPDPPTSDQVDRIRQLATYIDGKLSGMDCAGGAAATSSTPTGAQPATTPASPPPQILGTIPLGPTVIAVILLIGGIVVVVIIGIVATSRPPPMPAPPPPMQTAPPPPPDSLPEAPPPPPPAAPPPPLFHPPEERPPPEPEGYNPTPGDPIWQWYTGKGFIWDAEGQQWRYPTPGEITPDPNAPPGAKGLPPDLNTACLPQYNGWVAAQNALAQAVDTANTLRTQLDSAEQIQASNQIKASMQTGLDAGQLLASPAGAAEAAGTAAEAATEGGGSAAAAEGAAAAGAEAGGGALQGLLDLLSAAQARLRAIGVRISELTGTVGEMEGALGEAGGNAIASAEAQAVQAEQLASAAQAVESRVGPLRTQLNTAVGDLQAAQDVYVEAGKTAAYAPDQAKALLSAASEQGNALTAEARQAGQALVAQAQAAQEAAVEATGEGARPAIEAAQTQINEASQHANDIAIRQMIGEPIPQSLLDAAAAEKSALDAAKANMAAAQAAQREAVAAAKASTDGALQAARDTAEAKLFEADNQAINLVRDASSQGDKLVREARAAEAASSARATAANAKVDALQSQLQNAPFPGRADQLSQDAQAARQRVTDLRSGAASDPNYAARQAAVDKARSDLKAAQIEQGLDKTDVDRLQQQVDTARKAAPPPAPPGVLGTIWAGIKGAAGGAAKDVHDAVVGEGQSYEQIVQILQAGAQHVKDLKSQYTIADQAVDTARSAALAARGAYDTCQVQHGFWDPSQAAPPSAPLPPSDLPQ